MTPCLLQITIRCRRIPSTLASIRGAELGTWNGRMPMPAGRLTIVSGSQRTSRALRVASSR